jgi:hypothetical protein
MTAHDRNDPNTVMRQFGILLVPASMVLAGFCFYWLNSTRLLWYCLASLLFSAAGFLLLRRFQGPLRHLALVALATTGLLSVAAALLRLTN